MTQLATVNESPLPAVELDATATRILDAALTEFARVGLRNTTMESVARAAGVSHMTVYRRWGSRAALEHGVVAREARKLFALFDDLIASGAGAEEALVEGFVLLFQFARGNPLLRLVDSDSEIVLPMLTTTAVPVLAIARSYLAGQLRQAQAEGTVGDFDADGVAEFMVRIAHSLVLIPESCHPLDTDDDIRAYARRYLAPMLSITAHHE